jgi:hypothetical protein
MANKPNNPALWSKAKSLAKQKFDVYPSAYANGWAAKWYKGKGGTWRKAEYGMEVPMMADGGKPEWLLEAQLKAQGYSGDALQQKMSSMAQGGEPQNAGFQALPESVQAKILANMGYGGYIPEMAYGGAAQQAAIAIAMKKAGKKPKSMQDGGEPDGAMALGQIDAAIDKLQKLRQFVKPDSDLEPWVSSKITLMDHYTDAVSDYMMYNPEAQGEMMEEPEGLPMEEMKMGGIPERYKNMGFTKVGVKKDSTRPGKKWMVLAKKGDQYKVVHGGYTGMKDYTQHGSEKRRDRFWDRMGGKNSAKATDPFSPLYWHKRFGTWQEGGEIENPEMKNGGSTWSGNAWYNMGGYVPEYGMGGMPCYECGGMYEEGGESEMMAPEPPAYRKKSGLGKFIKPVRQWTGRNDSKLEDIIEFIDPTGITSWDDAAEAIRNIGNGKKKGFGKAVGTVASIASALPKMRILMGVKPMEYTSMPKWAQTVNNIRGNLGFGPNIFRMLEKNLMPGAKVLGPYDQGSPSLTYKDGGIYIDPAKKGTFKAQATRMGMSTQEAAAHILANKEDYSPAMVKKANFARNFAKQDGGPVVGQEMEVSPEQLEELRRMGYEFEMV